MGSIVMCRGSAVGLTAALMLARDWRRVTVAPLSAGDRFEVRL